MSSLEDIQKKIEELKQYVTMWERLQGLETINLESLINHKIDSIRDCNQDQSVAGVEKWAQVVKLQQDLRDKSTLVQDSMRKNGLQFEEEPPVEEPPMEEPPVEQSILGIWGKVPHLYEVASVETLGSGHNSLLPKTGAKNYLVLHSQKPLYCALVRDYDLDDGGPGRSTHLEEGFSWSGFYVGAVSNVSWETSHVTVNVTFGVAGDINAPYTSRLNLVFRGAKAAEGWMSDLRILTEGHFTYGEGYGMQVLFKKDGDI